MTDIKTFTSPQLQQLIADLAQLIEKNEQRDLVTEVQYEYETENFDRVTQEA